jgi:hypothetical protein
MRLNAYLLSMYACAVAASDSRKRAVNHDAQRAGGDVVEGALDHRAYSAG